ncbi:MAG: cardiolipin synthase [Muribaculaceae bacterium]|nr:cardiolipin synthase [Muribaculaceae bacterium]
MDKINYLILIIISVAYIVTIISCIVIVLKENRNPIRSLAWVIALIFLPIVGLIFYLFFGRSLKGEHMISRRNRRRIISRLAPRHSSINDSGLSQSDKNLIKLCRSLSSSFFTVNNEIEIFTTGQEKFDALKRDLKTARSSIYLQYYIFSDDSTGQEIADILIAKAREGVEVKVIYDHVGSFSARSRFFRNMQENGIEIHPFFRVTFPQLANRINWRNHRKIVVIDGEIGYMGGMNIADRYQRGASEGIAWRDTHFRLRGDIVESLSYSFFIDWNFKNNTPKITFPKVAPVSLRNNMGMQLITSGPVDTWDNQSLCFLKAISSATKSIFIQTPYFLPTDALQHALEAAALAKIDVRIMIPGKSDSRMLQYAGHSFVSQCLRAGIKVYHYNPGMLHAKGIIIDDNIVIAGSTNFDYRSFENNFECSLIIYDKDVNRRMRDIFFADVEKSTKLTFSEWHKRPMPQRIMESIVRLVSPIL